ncbi:hypothetical protein C9I98_18090 [Photobacterium sanctipauli]|uniref:DUF1496 domain-containing protein n=1 Tax=Photobacterium sanctipauli TaxID=1342794 RepID=A0A2T3NP03_9GAMM|nr:hypothetical protein [Photobacterium sanctipauli]PSW18006.1 hypothetical protein C9I98_18090 [Photobacterium sanctipauli]
MKKLFVLFCIAFSSFTFAEGMSGGSSATVPYIICMQDGKILGTTAIPVYECDKLKKAEAKKSQY